MNGFCRLFYNRLKRLTFVLKMVFSKPELQEIKKIVLAVTRDRCLADDLFQDVVLILLQKPEDVRKLREKEKLMKYVYATAFYQFNNPNNKFHSNFVKALPNAPAEQLDDFAEIDNFVLKNCTTVQNKIFELLLQGNSLRKVARLTGVKFYSVRKEFLIIKRKLRENFPHTPLAK